MNIEAYTPDPRGRGKRKIAVDTLPKLVADLHDSDCTLEQLGEKYGVTRERIRQLGKKWGIDGAKRRKQRSQKLVQSKVRHDRFNEAYNAVWKEAERRGFKVAAWADSHGEIKRSALFINARRCWVSLIDYPIRAGGKRLYWHITRGRKVKMREGTRIFVCDYNNERSFYIFMLGETVPQYIPATPPARALNKQPMNDCSQFKNAWHLLGDCNEPA